jgi:hypothetical protein
MTADAAVVEVINRSANRTKDLDDARNVLAVRRDDLDLAEIRRWCAVHGTTTTLLRLLPEAGMA